MVDRLRALTSGPFGVDLICAETGFGQACTDLHIDACVQLGVPLVVFHHAHRWRAGSPHCAPRAFVCGCRPPRPRSHRLQSDSASTG